MAQGGIVTAVPYSHDEPEVFIPLSEFKMAKKTKKSQEKSNAGRKVFDGKDEKDVLAKLEQAFLYGCTDEEACLYAEISVDALYRYCKKNEEFRNRKEHLKKHPILIAREAVVKSLPDDPKLAWDFLQKKMHKEFKQGIDTTITEEEAFTEEEKEGVREVLRKNGILKSKK